jgi:hypothetical protein
VLQIGEELWAGWNAGQEPWLEPDLNPRHLDKGEWIASALRSYFNDLRAFAKDRSYRVSFAVQFQESRQGGSRMPLPPNAIQNIRQGYLDPLVANLGPMISYMTTSMHYRGTWDRWLGEPEMQLAFITDRGQGSLGEIRTWFRKYVASKGYPNVDIIPHENSFGHLPDGALSPADWQKGLMASQYLMEAIIAGYGYTFGYPGFGGNYENIGADPHASITATIDGRYQRLPMFYALKLIGDPLRGANASLIDVEETDPATISMGLEWRDPHRHVSLYLINKHGTAQKETAVFDVDVSDKPVQVRRYSAAEMTGPMIRPESVVKRDSQKNRLEISLSPYSMTVIDVTLD